MNLELTVIVTIAAALLSVQGCSLFSPRVSNGPENAGFRQTASVASNPIPLPVEIVSDISMIASGGNIPQEGVWRPNYPQPEIAEAPEAAVPVPVTTAPGSPVPEPAREVTLNPDGTVNEADANANTTDDSPVKEKSTHRRRVASTGGKTVTYKVRSGDTLMKISFEKFGNIYRWREIYDSNKSRISNLNRLTAGTVLTIQGVEYLVIERNGTPYLIRRGDTLVKISKNVYDTPTEWKSIWKNNRQLIHDPNKIYAGFTLYYVPKKSDEVPQQVRQISTEKPGDKPRATRPGKVDKAIKKPAEASVTPVVPAMDGSSAGPETIEPESRTIPGVNLAPTSVSAPSADGAWTPSPATPMASPTSAP
jgi:nucleoid-associated protein YgaU